MSKDFFVCDSEGNDIEEAYNLDEAIRVAARVVLDLWPDFEIAKIGENVESGEGPDIETVVVTRLHVERAGPRGCRRVRITVPGAAWLAWERDFSVESVAKR